MAGTTLQPEDPGVTIHGMPLSLGVSVFVISCQTEDLTPPQQAMFTAAVQQPYIILDGSSINMASDAINIEYHSLKPADPSISTSSTLVSLAPPSLLVVGSHTAKLAFAQSLAGATPSNLNFDGESVPIEVNKIVLAGATLTPEAPVTTAGGTPVSLGTSALVVGTHMTSSILPSPAVATSHIIVSGHTTTVAASSIVFAGITLTPGAPLMMANGTPLSLGSSILVISTQPTGITFPTASRITNPGGGIGAIILSNLLEIDAGTVAAPMMASGTYNSHL